MTMTLAVSSKKCNDCDIVKPTTEFSRVGPKKDRFNSYCKPCASIRSAKWYRENRNRAIAMSLAARDERNPELKRATLLLRKYGLTIERYNEMLEEQDGGCAICQTKIAAKDRDHMFVDHCHATGVVRGLLCRVCNMVLGMFKDNPDRFDSAAAYLRRDS